MANYAVLVTLLLATFLPSNLASTICYDSKADVEAQCAARGGQCDPVFHCGMFSRFINLVFLEKDL